MSLRRILEDMRQATEKGNSSYTTGAIDALHAVLADVRDVPLLKVIRDDGRIPAQIHTVATRNHAIVVILDDGRCYDIMPGDGAWNRLPDVPLLPPEDPATTQPGEKNDE